MSLTIDLLKMISAAPVTDYDVDAATVSILEMLASRASLDKGYWDKSREERAACESLRRVERTIIENACAKTLHMLRHTQHGWSVIIYVMGNTDEQKQLTISRLLAIQKRLITKTPLRVKFRQDNRNYTEAFLLNPSS